MKLLNFYTFILIFSTTITAQDSIKTVPENWKFKGAVGLDFAQMLLINPKIGAGENKIAFGGNAAWSAVYEKDRFLWNSGLNINFGIQKLGSGKKPFQKTLDELRLSTQFNYKIAKESHWSYTLDIAFLSQLTPTYEGNYLAAYNGSMDYPFAKFFSPTTLMISPGISYKPNKNLMILFSPISYKTIMVADDSIAKMSNADRSSSLHGTPFGERDRNEFIKRWHVKPRGQTYDGIYYAKNSLQLGAAIKVFYQQKFWKFKDVERIGISSSLSLFSDYLHKPQYIDFEWINNFDFFIFKGLSISLGTILFYDYDVLVQINKDGDMNTGVNGLEATGRRLSFTEILLIKYNYLF
jgi:hypothetical protein